MKICAICKKTSDEVQLFPGIQDSEMINICENCAAEEGVPILKKPSISQLKKADVQYTVRERMERLSGVREATEISEDQIITQGNLAKLKAPPEKQQNDDVLDNYYWTLNMARRRAKMSTGQLAVKMQVDPRTIRNIERGIIPENFEEIFLKLESFFGIKLLKNHKAKVQFIKPSKDEAEKILEEVRQKMQARENGYEPPEDLTPKKERLEKLSRGEIDFSKREQLSDVTLNDLVEMKRRRERKELMSKTKAQEDALIGDDIELEIEEL